MMLQLRNTSPFAAVFQILPDERARDQLIVAIKATFHMHPGLEIAEAQLPIAMADIFWGDPEATSLAVAADFSLPKPGTDVLLIGTAQAREQRPVRSVDCTLRIGDRAKTVRVHGPRMFVEGFAGPAPSAPEPFTTLPIRYEAAAGGTFRDPETGAPLKVAWANPVGRGIEVESIGSRACGLPVPNLEDPRCPLGHPEALRRPAAFGPVAPTWEPRRHFAGTYDHSWRKHRAPFLPKDFDRHFCHVAPPDLVFDEPLVGGEPVELVNLSPRGVLHLQLPRCRLNCTTIIRGRRESLTSSLAAVLIEPDEERLTLVWHAGRDCGQSYLEIDCVEVALDRLETR